MVMTGIAWYSRDEWDMFRASIVDADSMHRTYDEWLAQAEKTKMTLEGRGLQIVKVPIVLDELLRWCEARGLPCNGAARSQYVMDKANENDSG